MPYFAGKDSHGGKVRNGNLGKAKESGEEILSHTSSAAIKFPKLQ